MKIKLFVVAVVGIILGIVASRYLLVGSGLSLIPWGIIGLLIGVWCPTYRQAIYVGALYGFLLAFSFMAAGYQGSAPILSRVPFFTALGIFGALCGLCLGLIGAFIHRKIGPAS